MDAKTHPYFVPNDQEGSRQETAVLLVGTAHEFEIPQREIASTMGGFNITQRVFDAVFGDEADAADPDPSTSGNRAAKTSTKEEE